MWFSLALFACCVLCGSFILHVANILFSGLFSWRGICNVALSLQLSVWWVVWFFLSVWRIQFTSLALCVVSAWNGGLISVPLTFTLQIKPFKLIKPGGTLLLQARIKNKRRHFVPTLITKENVLNYLRSLAIEWLLDQLSNSGQNRTNLQASKMRLFETITESLMVVDTRDANPSWNWNELNTPLLVGFS